MASFEYTGRASTGEIQNGAIDAVDVNAAAKTLISKHITPIQISPISTLGKQSAKTPANEKPIHFVGNKIQLYLFCQRKVCVLSRGQHRERMGT